MNECNRCGRSDLEAWCSRCGAVVDVVKVRGQLERNLRSARLPEATVRGYLDTDPRTAAVALRAHIGGARPQGITAEVLRVLDALGDHATREERRRMAGALAELMGRTRPGSEPHRIATAALAPQNAAPAQPTQPAGVGLHAMIVVTAGGVEVLIADQRPGELSPPERAALEIFAPRIRPTPGLQAARLEQLATLIPTEVKGAGGVAEVAAQLRAQAVFS